MICNLQPSSWYLLKKKTNLKKLANISEVVSNLSVFLLPCIFCAKNNGPNSIYPYFSLIVMMSTSTRKIKQETNKQTNQVMFPLY